MCGKQRPPTRLGSARCWRHRGEGRLLAQCLRLLCGTQLRPLSPLGGAWPGTPFSGPRLPLVKFALYLQMSLPILTMVPSNRILLLGRSTCSELQGNWRVEESGSSRWWWGLLCVLKNARSTLPKGTWVWVPESTVACSLLYGGSKVPLWLACPLSPTCRTRAGRVSAQARICRVVSPQFPLLPP